MMFFDGHDTGTNGDYRYGYPYCKHSIGLCETRMGVGVRYWSCTIH